MKKRCNSQKSSLTSTQMQRDRCEITERVYEDADVQQLCSLVCLCVLHTVLQQDAGTEPCCWESSGFYTWNGDETSCNTIIYPLGGGSDQWEENVRKTTFIHSLTLFSWVILLNYDLQTMVKFTDQRSFTAQLHKGKIKGRWQQIDFTFK